MAWLAWRQFRMQALVTLGLLAAFALLVLITGLHLHHVYSSVGSRGCRVSFDCTGLAHMAPLQALLGPALVAIPALLGIFWGAPLVARELETGTFRLAWTQSVTRRRWLSVRVGLVGLAALVVAALCSALVSWWFAPVDAVELSRLHPSVFDARGLVPIGYAGFAFALGIVAGTVIRRTLPAMMATLAGFVAVRVAFTLWLRPHLLASREVLEPVTLGKGLEFLSNGSRVSVYSSPPPIPGTWTTSATLVDPAGHVLGSAQVQALLTHACPTIAAALRWKGSPVQHCLIALSHHLQQLVSYQPASHFWSLQALETGIFLVAALALVGITVWRVGRHAVRRPSAGVARERNGEPLASILPALHRKGTDT